MKTLLRLDSLKRRAKDIKKAYGLRHNVALDLVALHLGFRDWSALANAFNRGGVSLPMIRTDEGGLEPWSAQFHRGQLPESFAEFYRRLSESRERFVYTN